MLDSLLLSPSLSDWANNVAMILIMPAKYRIYIAELDSENAICLVFFRFRSVCECRHSSVAQFKELISHAISNDKATIIESYHMKTLFVYHLWVGTSYVFSSNNRLRCVYLYIFFVVHNCCLCLQFDATLLNLMVDFVASRCFEGGYRSKIFPTATTISIPFKMHKGTQNELFSLWNWVFSSIERVCLPLSLSSLSLSPPPPFFIFF